MKNFAVKRLSIAEEDIFDAGRWYLEQGSELELDRRFLAEVEATTRALRTDALFHCIRFGDVRRAPLKRFGIYGVYYVVRGDSVIVIAVFHDRRDRRRLRARRRNVDAQL